MKTQILETPAPARRIPEVGEFFTHEDEPGVYFRMIDSEGRAAYEDNVSPNPADCDFFYALHLGDGEVYEFNLEDRYQVLIGTGPDGELQFHRA